MNEVDMSPVSDAIAKASKALLKAGEAGSEAFLSGLLRDAIKNAGAPLPDGDTHGNGGYAILAQEAQGRFEAPPAMRAVLRRSDKDSWQRRLSAGRLDRRAYGRLASGDHSNPYAKHTFSPGYETEITIILDGSDSMSMGLKLQRAASLALVVAQAAEQVGVKCEIVRFFGRQVVSIKAPRERLGSASVQARLGYASRATNGSTPLTQSIALCAKRLAVRAPAKRKMIFAVTDGVCDCGRTALRKVTEHCDNAGVEVIGLSIDSLVHDAFRFEARVDSEDDVAKAGLGVLVKALENRPGLRQRGCAMNAPRWTDLMEGDEDYFIALWEASPENREREAKAKADRALEWRETQERMVAADKRQRELDAQSDKIARRVIVGALALVLALVWALW